MHKIKNIKFLVNMLLWLIITFIFNCCGSGTNSSQKTDNLSSNWTLINKEKEQAPINSISINSTYNSLIVLTQKNLIHAYNILEKSWQDIEALPNNNIAKSITTVENLNIIYAGLNDGKVMSHNIVDLNNKGLSTSNNFNWIAVGNNNIEDIAPITSILKSSDKLFIGNSKGNIWLNQNDLWKKISSYSPSKAISHVKIDNSNNFLGILNTDGELWICVISLNKCTDMINLLKKMKIEYTDKSPIKSISLYSNNDVFYGYWGNENGNIWRIIINNIYKPEDGCSLTKLSDDPNFPGYHNTKPITALLVNNNYNDLYVSTQEGDIWIFDTNDRHWHNIKNQNNILLETITAMAIAKNNALYVGSDIGNIWQVSIKGLHN